MSTRQSPTDNTCDLLLCTPQQERNKMAKEIIVNADLAEELRIAIVEDGKLSDLDIETQSRTKHKGNIYKGIVSNIEDSLDAAFIDIGEEKQAFLPRSEIRPSLYPEGLQHPKRAKISEILERGQEIVVQVTKDEIGNKGAAVSTYLSLPGRYVVLMHSDESGGGISRKIENETARRAARDMLSRLSVPEGMAVIIRTAGMNATRQDLLRDFKTLCDVWQQVDKGSQLGRAPTLIYREPDIVVRTIRDYFSADVKRVVIDDEEEYEEALSYFKIHMPDLEKILERHRKKEPIFQSFGIESAIEDLFQRQVKLPSGGYIIIEQTEALVSIDVNSGKSTQEEDHEATVYKTNLEAADELARQLRLRDLGGIVVIDFIDMVSRRHRRDVEKRLRDAMETDKARIKVGRISENGTLELTRQRLRQSHHLISHVSCPHCDGTGRIRDAEGSAISALRQIHGHLSKKKAQLAKLTVRLPVQAANMLNNLKRRELLNLTESHEVDIEVLGDASISGSAIEFKEEKRGQAGLEAASYNRDTNWKDKKQNRSKNQTKEKWSAKPKTTPPPTIGPVPTLIEIEEPPEVEDEEIPLHALKAPQNALQEHYEDPILHALFGAAKKLAKPLAPPVKAATEKPAHAEPREKATVQAQQVALEEKTDENSHADNVGNQIIEGDSLLPSDSIGNSEHFSPNSAQKNGKPRRGGRGHQKRFPRGRRPKEHHPENNLQHSNE